MFARDVMVVLFLAGFTAARRGRPVDAADLRRTLVGDRGVPPDFSAAPVPEADLPGEVSGALREMAWRRRRRFPSDPEPAWDDSVPAVLAATLALGGAGHASRAHLASVLAPGVEVRRTVVEPYAPLVDELGLTGALEGRATVVDRLFRRTARWGMRRAGPHGVLLRALAGETARQAVRAGHPSVTTAHGLLAVLALDDQLAATGRRLAGRFRAGNGAGEVLRGNGVPARAGSDPEGPTSAGPVFPEAVGGPPWSETVRAAFDRAALAADEPGTAHLVAELLATDGAAGRLVRAAGADPAAVARGSRQVS